ncbi:hypothetical protein DAEQUDRAFT_759178 [Daedalea quercina L-15889]|uniref:DUF6534 domain-containing protein n=1 Tax=Daedalea quercina L-15889 TaxID=1314783 RepID=A0A165MJQ5_9APHY|nr:hypothetical protein DAEQUDRAFT_759178 [Daedalea quercina L-15889]
MTTAHLSLGLLLGCMFIAELFAAVLYGFACSQFMYYIRHYWAHDGLFLKCIVLSMWLLETLLSASEIYIIWIILVEGHGSSSSLLNAPKVFALEFATLSLDICVVQMFYVYGLWQLLQGLSCKAKIVLTISPAALSLLSLAFSFVGMQAMPASGWIISSTLSKGAMPIVVKVWSAAVADVYICLALTWVLYKKRTGLKQTDNILYRLITYVVNRGILSTVAQICLCATYLAFAKQDNLIWVIFYEGGGKIYVNSMMAALNARQHLRSQLSHDVYLSAFNNDMQEVSPKI